MNRHYSPNHMKKVKFSLPLRRLYLTAAMLLVIAVGTSVRTSTTLARYTSTASGSSTAQVAAFVVNAAAADTQSAELTVSEDSSSASYAFSVSNFSGDVVCGVETSYDVTVKFPSALSGVTLTLTDGGGEAIQAQTTDDTTYTFAGVGDFSPGVSRTDALTLNFALQDGAEANVWDGISITVNAAQVD
jgi:hypothetical protein